LKDAERILKEYTRFLNLDHKESGRGYLLVLLEEKSNSLDKKLGLFKLLVEKSDMGIMEKNNSLTPPILCLLKKKDESSLVFLDYLIKKNSPYIEKTIKSNLCSALLYKSDEDVKWAQFLLDNIDGLNILNKDTGATFLTESIKTLNFDMAILALNHEKYLKNLTIEELNSASAELKKIEESSVKKEKIQEIQNLIELRKTELYNIVVTKLELQNYISLEYNVFKIVSDLQGCIPPVKLPIKNARTASFDMLD
jgi:hypothetical protein